MSRLSARIKHWVQQADLRLGTAMAVRINHHRRGLHRRDLVFRPDQLAFVHVPKTGGTTLWQVLREALPADALVGGVHHVPVSRRCPPGPYRYVTILRDPAERVWSHYQMVLRHGSTDPYYFFACKGLQSYLDNCWEASDMITCYLAGRPRSAATEALLDQALRNLERFAYVLDFADLEGEIRRLLAALGVPAPASGLPHCRRAQKQSWTQAQRQLIEAHNSYDRRLFDAWRDSRTCSQRNLV